MNSAKSLGIGHREWAPLPLRGDIANPPVPTMNLEPMSVQLARLIRRVDTLEFACARALNLIEQGMGEAAPEVLKEALKK